MSQAEFVSVPLGTPAVPLVSHTTKGSVSKEHKSIKPLHRIAAVRECQGMSLPSCARRLGITLTEARHQEKPTTDLTLSQLMAWREALDVPLSELIGNADDFIEDPIQNRAKMVKIMKSARQIDEIAKETRVQRVAKMLVEQLVEVMPELEFVSAWPDVGQSHENRTSGIPVCRGISEETLSRLGF